MAWFVLGVDGGQTATKAAICDPRGRVLARVTAPGWDHMISPEGRRHCRAALSDVWQRLRPAAAGRTCRAACLGLTSGQAGSDIVARWTRALTQAADVIVVPDLVASLRGADPSGGPGVVVIAGGGSAAWGRTAAGRTALAGGHGYLLDDEGSGYELGRRAIITALKAAHGRRPRTALLDVVLRHFGAADVGSVRSMIYAGQAGRREIAALVPGIVGAARAGDRAATQILTDGAEALVEMAGAVIARLRLPEGPVYPVGGVFQAGKPIMAPFRAALRRRHPHARVRRPQLSPLGGALVLGLEAAGSWAPGAAVRLRHGLASA